MGLSGRGRWRERVLRRLIRGSFDFWQRLGVHVTLNHFYEPVPDTRELADALWERQSGLVGIDLNVAEQLELLDLFASRFREGYEALPEHPTGVPHQYYTSNPNFGYVSGAVLYCMVRYFKPRRILEIGSGFSTLLLAQTVLENAGGDGDLCELTSVDPYPPPVLSPGVPGLARLLQVKAQEVPMSEFEALKGGDILFIDSSHVLNVSSDVRYEYLEVLPRLAKGVIVHIHDIYLPAEYPREWIIKKHRFWNEQYLLQAFLTGNRDFEVIWASNYLHLEHPDRLAAAFSRYRHATGAGGSFWIRRTGGKATTGLDGGDVGTGK